VPAFVVLRLTNEGHDFLAAAKEETRWAKAKDVVRKSIGTITLTALKTALNELVQNALKHR
jgi:two-component sensor histidine kinase